MENSVPNRRVVLIADASLEQALLQEIESLRFDAYSSVPCAGRTARSGIDYVFSATSHVRIEALGSPLSVQRLMHLVSEGALGRFGVACFSDAIEMAQKADADLAELRPACQW